MPIETHLFASGAWRKAKEIHVKDGGVWRDCKEKWVKEGGVWRKVFGKGFEFNADISGYNYNLRNAAMATGQWDGFTPVIANLRVVGTLGSNPPKPYNESINTENPEDWYNARRNVGAQYPNYPAFDSGALPAGSEINLVIMPGVHLVGAGGFGGCNFTTNNRWHNTPIGPNGASYFEWICEDGMPGSPAIRTSVLTRITNNGLIGGGGGGGAGSLGPVAGQYWSGVQFNSFANGGAGGGGAGYDPGLAYNAPYVVASGSTINNASRGFDGNLTTGGAGGLTSGVGGARPGTVGGKGGDLGQAGGDGGSRLAGELPRYLRVGGAAGAAVIGSANVIWQAYGDVRGPLA